MGLKSQIDQDLKTALLSHDKQTTSVLRGIKSTILNSEIEAGKRDQGLDDDEITKLLMKEVKKRQESALLYEKGGNAERASQELAEKEIIEQYLPKQATTEEIETVVTEIINQLGAKDISSMGMVIGQAKQKLGATADGAVLAGIVKEKLSGNSA